MQLFSSDCITVRRAKLATAITKYLQKQEQQSLHVDVKSWCQHFNITTHTHTLPFSVMATRTQHAVTGVGSPLENFTGEHLLPFINYADGSHSHPKRNLQGPGL